MATKADVDCLRILSLHTLCVKRKHKRRRNNLIKVLLSLRGVWIRLDRLIAERSTTRVERLMIPAGRHPVSG